MSLLLKALQRAAKTRETLPPPSRDALAATPGAASRGRTRIASSEPVPAAGSDGLPEMQPRGAAAAVAGGRGDGFSLVEWSRDNPVHAFGGAVVVFLVGYFIYVYLAINYPTLFTRNASSGISVPRDVRAVARVPTASSPPPSAEPSGTAPPAAPMPSLDTATLASTSDQVAPSDVPPPATTAVETGQRQSATDSKSAASVTGAHSTGKVAAVEEVPAVRRSTQATTTRVSPASGVRSREPATVRGTDQALQIRPTLAGDLTARQLETAYEALQKGDLRTAASLYEGVLQRDNRNLDALLGNAAVAWREGRAEQASDIYYRVLELDPRNAAAQAGLIGMLGRIDPVASETRLKQLIAREPSGFLYTALGNIYADQGQWASAQGAYFKAFQSDPANADYAFNLAVGLDRIGQSSIAANYYRQALALASAHGSGSFDKAQVRSRLDRLSGTLE